MTGIRFISRRLIELRGLRLIFKHRTPAVLLRFRKLRHDFPGFFILAMNRECFLEWSVFRRAMTCPMPFSFFNCDRDIGFRSGA